MSNYKIKVNNEAESREAQELFFEFGYGFFSGKNKAEEEFEYTGEFYFFAYGSDCDLTVSKDHNLFLAKSDFKEITIPQLRDLVAQSKNEQGLISGADALRALADGDYVEYWCEDLEQWVFMDMQNHFKRKFRLKPRTIKLDGIYSKDDLLKLISDKFS